MLVAKTDVPPSMTYRQAARKAVAMCVSDFAAKGVKPVGFLISLGLPRETAESEVEEIALGLRDAAVEWDIKLVGGDTNESNDLVIDCTMFGFSDRIITRGGARPHQLVITTGYFGYTSAGLRILMRGATCDPNFRERAIKSVLVPKPRLNYGIRLSKYLSSSIDSSDGLAMCLHSIAEMSGVGIVIEKLPVNDEIKKFASENGYPLEEIVMFGGEEYEIVGTIDKGKIKWAEKLARLFSQELIVIGRTTSEHRKVYISDDSSLREIPKKGWVHFT